MHSWGTKHTIIDTGWTILDIFDPSQIKNLCTTKIIDEGESSVWACAQLNYLLNNLDGKCSIPDPACRK
eukprot:SAG31_NODE_547_length_14228_cov_3.787105_13_plen_69_part_00